jgi:hypothetical protein
MSLIPVIILFGSSLDDWSLGDFRLIPIAQYNQPWSPSWITEELTRRLKRAFILSQASFIC